MIADTGLERIGVGSRGRGDDLLGRLQWSIYATTECSNHSKQRSKKCLACTKLGAIEDAKWAWSELDYTHANGRIRPVIAGTGFDLAHA